MAHVLIGGVLQVVDKKQQGPTAGVIYESYGNPFSLGTEHLL